MLKSWHARAFTLGVAAVLALGACGGDDDDDAGGASDTTSAADGGAEPAAFCETFRAVDVELLAVDESGDPAAATAALEAAEAEAPEEISEAVATMVAAGKEQLAQPQTEDGPPYIPPAEFFTASSEVGDYLSENCAFNALDVTAANYEFTDVPSEVDAGEALIRLQNEGTEFHEIALFKIADGEERPIEELLQLPDEEIGALATPVAFAFAPPDAEGITTAELEPGRHVALCFIPVGSTPDVVSSGAPPDEDASPHFMEGMVAEFQVS